MATAFFPMDETSKRVFHVSPPHSRYFSWASSGTLTVFLNTENGWCISPPAEGKQKLASLSSHSVMNANAVKPVSLSFRENVAHWQANSVVGRGTRAFAPLAFITTFQWNQLNGQSFGLRTLCVCTLSVRTTRGGWIWWCELESRQSKIVYLFSTVYSLSPLTFLPHWKSSSIINAYI